MYTWKFGSIDLAQLPFTNFITSFHVCSPSRSSTDSFPFGKPEQWHTKDSLSSINNCNPSISFSSLDCSSECSLDPLQWAQTQHWFPPTHSPNADKVSSVAQGCGLLVGTTGHSPHTLEGPSCDGLAASPWGRYRDEPILTLSSSQND